MGGSPKVAVDNIKEVLNINQKRKDFLGEPLHPPCHNLCSLQRTQSPQPGVSASWLYFSAFHFSGGGVHCTQHEGS